MAYDLPKLAAVSFPWSHHATKIEHRRIGQWALRVETDRFSGRVTCTLSEPRVRYERRALVFQLSARANTIDAAYRVDAAAPVWARSDVMELAHQGFALHDDDLANPSGGVVRIPSVRLQGARTVSIQAQSNLKPVKFHIDGFADALAAAHAAGCGGDDFR